MPLDGDSGATAVQIEQHELPGVEAETLLRERPIELAAKRDQLSFDAPDIGNSPKRFERAG